VILVESLVYYCVSVVVCHLSVFLSLVHMFIFLIVFVLAANSRFVCFDVCDNINVGSIDVFQCAALGVYSYTHRFVDTGNLNTISWSYLIYHILIGAKMDCLGCFTLRNALRCFLDFDMLLV